MSAQFIEKDGVPEFAVLPFAEYEYLMNIVEDKIDTADVHAFRESGEEVFPESVLESLLAGDHPIKVYRKYRNMTQPELAAAIGKSLPYITKLEASDRKGTVDVLSDIANVLRVDLDQLI